MFDVNQNGTAIRTFHSSNPSCVWLVEYYVVLMWYRASPKHSNLNSCMATDEDEIHYLFRSNDRVQLQYYMSSSASDHIIWRVPMCYHWFWMRILVTLLILCVITLSQPTHETTSFVSINKLQTLFSNKKKQKKLHYYFFVSLRWSWRKTVVNLWISFSSFLYDIREKRAGKKRGEEEMMRDAFGQNSNTYTWMDTRKLRIVSN